MTTKLSGVDTFSVWWYSNGMIRDGNKIRLTRDELNKLRQANAKQGHAINDVRTMAECLQACLGALDVETQADMLEFLETGSSPRIRQIPKK